jgi:PAS domain S-box-containing protein
MTADEMESSSASQATGGRLHAIDRVVPVSMRWVAYRAVLTGLACAVVLAIPFFIYYRAESQQVYTRLESDRAHVLHLSSLMVRQDIASVLSDLRFLSSHSELVEFLAMDDPYTQWRLAQEYAHVLLQKRDYDRIRIIGPDGRERIRVSQTPRGVQIAPPEALTDRKDRYYFTEAMRLDPDQIYVSPMDLDVTNGKVVQPLKPTIRFCVGLFDENGHRKGILVLNYLAGHLINRIRDISRNSPDTWLLDERGYWLIGPNPGDEWGFIFPGRQEVGFAYSYPVAWRQIRSQASGTSADGDLLFKYLRVYPLSPPAPAGDVSRLAMPVGWQQYYWTLVSVVIPETTQGGTTQLQNRLISIYGILVMLSFLPAAALSYTSARNRTLTNILEKVVDNASMLVSYVDASQRYRFNNKAYEDVFGSSPRRLYGQKVREVLGEALYQTIRPHMEQALAGRKVDFEVRIGNSLSGPKEMAVAYLPDVDADGKVIGFYAVANDVTAFREAERRARQQMLDLAHMSRLASVGEVTTEISHQVNQPLAAIAMFSAAALRTLREGEGVERAMEWLEQINAQAKRAAEVVQRLRRFVRKGETQRVALNLNEMVREVLSLVEHSARNHDVEMRLELDDPLPAVRADKLLIEQVVYNLTRNALEAAAERSAPRLVQIRTWSDADHVHFQVEDSGPGVAEELSGCIFESFTTSKPDGLGMGLAISRSIVESHEGVIEYHNRLGGGAVFSFRLLRGGP